MTSFMEMLACLKGGGQSEDERISIKISGRCFTKKTIIIVADKEQLAEITKLLEALDKKK